MKVRMLKSETGRVEPEGRAKHFRAGQTYDVSARIADAWGRVGVAVKVGDSEELPEGYKLKKAKGGYFTVTGPDGVVEGPSNGKWQGRDGAALGAWNHFKGGS